MSACPGRARCRSARSARQSGRVIELAGLDAADEGTDVGVDVEQRGTARVAGVAQDGKRAVAGACASKWVNRWRRHGELGLDDRPSTPHHSPDATPARVIERIETWRREKKWSANRITHELAELDLRINRRTVTRHLTRLGLGQGRFIDPSGHSNRKPGKIIGHGDPGRRDRPGPRTGAGHHLDPSQTRCLIVCVATMPPHEIDAFAVGTDELAEVRWVSSPEAAELMGDMSEAVRQYRNKRSKASRREEPTV